MTKPRSSNECSFYSAISPNLCQPNSERAQIQKQRSRFSRLRRRCLNTKGLTIVVSNSPYRNGSMEILNGCICLQKLKRIKISKLVVSSVGISFQKPADRKDLRIIKSVVFPDTKN